MGMFTAITTAATGLSAQRLRQDVIADNLANVNTTRTAEGGPFQRSRVIVRPVTQGPYPLTPFAPRAIDEGLGRGVHVEKIEKDRDAKPKLVYDPTHPDAVKVGPNAGYVEMPNVSVVNEMVDLISASRSYDANVAVVNSAKSMFQKGLEIGSRA